MKLAIHQLEFVSYLGFWEKISNVDKLVLLDEVNFRKNYFQNRNKIILDGSESWFGIEIQKSTNKPIKEVLVSDVYNPIKKIKTLGQAYKKAPYFEMYAQGIINILKVRRKHLIEYNFMLFMYIRDCLGLEIEEIISQSMEEYKGEKEELILDICKVEGASTYLSGKSGRDYLDLSKFEAEKIDVVFQEYQHPIYNQFNTEKFKPFMSIIDLLFNEGPNSLKILRNEK